MVVRSAFEIPFWSTAIRTVLTHHSVRAIIARMPTLRHIGQARNYSNAPPLRPPDRQADHGRPVVPRAQPARRLHHRPLGQAHALLRIRAALLPDRLLQPLAGPTQAVYSALSRTVPCAHT